MSRNESALDRTVRVLVGAGLLALTFVGPRTLWGLAGLVPLATGVAGYCPLYHVLGIATRPTGLHAEPH